MSKKLVAAVVGALAVSLSAASASAGPIEPDIPRGVTPEQQTVDASAPFSVTYAQCVANFESVVFEFEGQMLERECVGANGVADALQPQGFRAVPAGFQAGSATAELTAPADAGTYTGVAYVVVRDQVDLQAPAQPQGFRGGGLVTQTNGCPGSFCQSFTVIVPQQVTTTVAPTPTQTPATTAAGVAGGGATNTLPATGASDSDNTATIAVVLLVAGFGLIVATRWRRASDLG